MKVKLTRKWKQRRPHLPSSSAIWGRISLVCNYSFYTDRWIGEASIIIGAAYYPRVGPSRTSIKLARRDAERLGVELLRDIRDGTKELMDKYGMGEDD